MLKFSRPLKQRVSSTKKRSHASALWLKRHINDPYVHASKNMGYRSRASFKLIELDDTYHFLDKAQRVVDLGCAPGGFSQVAAQRITQHHKGLVVGIDLLPVDPLPHCIFFEKNFLDDDTIPLILDALGGNADVVLSDMAPNTIGHQSTDHLRMMVLCEGALDFACSILSPGGTFVVKMFQGGSSSAFVRMMKQHFTKVVHAKPAASRPESSELYLIGLGFKGHPHP